MCCFCLTGHLHHCDWFGGQELMGLDRYWTTGLSTAWYGFRRDEIGVWNEEGHNTFDALGVEDETMNNRNHFD